MGQEAEVIEDGQHRHGYETAVIDVDVEGMKMVARHLFYGTCMPRPLKPDTQMPLMFVMEKDTDTTATVICSVCKKELGTTKVRIQGKR